MALILTFNLAAQDDGNFKFYWKDGLRFNTADKAFAFKFGGRIMNDHVFMGEDDDIRTALGKLEDGTEYGSYWLTGEHRKYKKSAGTFSRVKPKNNFTDDGGGGAWEVGLRLSGLDPEDSVIKGGDLSDITLGLNWHLNPNTRVLFNYINANLDSVGKANYLMTRFQIDF